MQIQEVIKVLEELAPPAYQESYDNTGLITGAPQENCTGIICTLDATEAVVVEAIEKGCNLIVAHHPIVFKGLTSITGKNYVERTIIKAIQHRISIYAIHTNLDNVLHGVNGWFAKKLGLINCKVLMPKEGLLMKLVTYVPVTHSTIVLEALFAAGAGNIGEYSEASFSSNGVGSFKGSAQSNPVIGKPGVRELVDENRIEVLLPRHLQKKVLTALFKNHPYEEVAYDVVPLLNTSDTIGSGLIGDLPEPVSENTFLLMLKKELGLNLIKHTELLNSPIKKVAICGGAGSFLTNAAIAAGAQFFVTSDVKYHEFFDANRKLVLADIGHWESEHYITNELFAVLTANFPNFAVLKTTVNTNPVRYFLG